MTPRQRLAPRPEVLAVGPVDVTTGRGRSELQAAQSAAGRRSSPRYDKSRLRQGARRRPRPYRAGARRRAGSRRGTCRRPCRTPRKPKRRHRPLVLVAVGAVVLAGGAVRVHDRAPVDAARTVAAATQRRRRSQTLVRCRRSPWPLESSICSLSASGRRARTPSGRCVPPPVRPSARRRRAAAERSRGCGWSSTARWALPARGTAPSARSCSGSRAVSPRRSIPPSRKRGSRRSAGGKLLLAGRAHDPFDHTADIVLSLRTLDFHSNGMVFVALDPTARC